jgi:1-pyrroline-5-carboxylate dehydrogenase
MQTSFPRVTYATAGVDLSPLHDYLDAEIPTFKARYFGRRWPNLVGQQADEGGQAYTVLSPIDNQSQIGTFISADASAVDRAVAHAAQAFAAWSSTPWQTRVERLRAWVKVLETRKYDLALAAMFEIAKSRVEALGEADEVLDMVAYYCSEVERNEGFYQPLRREFANEETSTRLRPLGVFGVIAPFNFPLALSINMITGALLTGNTVVFKPAPGCGISANIIMESLQEAGLGGLINMVCGEDQTGRALVAHPSVAGIAFTGSYAAGMAIFRTLNNGTFAKPVIAEMGGKNPAYVTASADLTVAAQGVARSAFGLQGQKCSACSVVYVQSEVKDSFLEQLLAFSSELQVGDPTQRNVFAGPIYDADAAKRFTDAVEAATRDGKVLQGGQALDVVGGGKGYYFSPAVVEVPVGHALTKDELFAPFLVVRTFDALADGIAEGNDVIYGLSAGIYTGDEEELEFFLNHAEAGVLYANRASGATTGAWPGVQSFCGWKGSGVSQKGGLGPNYLNQFMREQSHTLMR